MGDNKSTGNATASPHDIEESNLWPIIMIFICLGIALLGLAILFGWFYRTVVLEFVRESIHKCNNCCWRLNIHLWSKTSLSQGNVRPPPSTILTSKDIASNNPISAYYHQKSRPPVPPPRAKKTILSSQLNKEEEENNYCEPISPKTFARIQINNNINSSNNNAAQVRPDIIAQQPTHVTINGLAI